MGAEREVMDGIYHGVPGTILTEGMIEIMKREMTNMLSVQKETNEE